ncbi:YbaB/EbfC family nucleoid-associated protein [Saccharothrix deserti]|uniref:YbaB/EbfC family nucleoid-associated protein n=1 Tax=Saccharothrix deserti TaxID=2593674 RepID=UPI001EE47DBA|nr:YbaB/EbfC family nucleoid-associated protein [Saccharothrix deserti]
MIETPAQRVDRVFREFADVRARTQSRDGLITAVVDHRGRLLKLGLEPRVYRNLEVDDLARGVVATVRAAESVAHREAVEVAAVLLPGRRDPDEVDLVFDPLIDELDRLIANPPRPRRDAPSLPALEMNLDLGAFRQNLLDLRAQVTGISGTAVSGDGLITATTDGHGRLRDLGLNPRLYRVTDSGRLAADITGTVREAAERARDEVSAASARIRAGRSPRRRS